MQLWQNTHFKLTFTRLPSLSHVYFYFHTFTSTFTRLPRRSHDYFSGKTHHAMLKTHKMPGGNDSTGHFSFWFRVKVDGKVLDIEAFFGLGGERKILI